MKFPEKRFWNWFNKQYKEHQTPYSCALTAFEWGYKKGQRKFMFDTFEEYAAIMKIDKTHAYWDAFEMVWRMSRTPQLIADKTGKLKVKA